MIQSTELRIGNIIKIIDDEKIETIMRVSGTHLWRHWKINVVTEDRYHIDLHTHVPNCKHIHQLQNLYFALTGKELTINQTNINNDQ